jgi:hypothetical protein
VAVPAAKVIIPAAGIQVGLVAIADGSSSSQLAVGRTVRASVNVRFDASLPVKQRFAWANVNGLHSAGAVKVTPASGFTILVITVHPSIAIFRSVIRRLSKINGAKIQIFKFWRSNNFKNLKFYTSFLVSTGLASGDGAGKEDGTTDSMIVELLLLG